MEKTHLIGLVTLIILALLTGTAVGKDSVLYVDQGMGALLKNPDRIEIHSITNFTYPYNSTVEIGDLQRLSLAYNRYFARNASQIKFAPNGTITTVERYSDTFAAYHGGRAVNHGNSTQIFINSKAIGFGYSCRINETPTAEQLRSMAFAALKYVAAYPANETTGYKGIVEIDGQTDLSGYRLSGQLVCDNNTDKSCWINPEGGVPLNPRNFQGRKFCQITNYFARALGLNQTWDIGVGYNYYQDPASGEVSWWGPNEFLIRHDIALPPGYARFNMT